MKRLYSSILIVLFVTATAQFASAQSNNYSLDTNSTNKVMINGTSNVHDWECKVQDYNIDTQMDPAGLQDSASPSFLQKLDFRANVKSIECGKGKMNDKTYDILKAKKYPQITFAMDKSVLSSVKSVDDFKLNVTGDLTIAGVTKSITLPVEGQKVGDNGYHFTGSYKIKTKDFDVDRVSMFFGAIKTGDEVTIPFDVTLVER